MKHRILICLLVMVFISHNAHAQYRSAAFTMQNAPSAKAVTLPQTFQTDDTVPLSLSSPIYSFSISGSATLSDTSNSLIRVTLVDNYDMEYLVYEIYPLLTDRWQFDFEDMAFETSDMGGLNATKINITVLNAKLTMNEYHYTTEPVRPVQRQQRFKSQQQYVIETLNANLEARDMPWRAGETSVSGLSYEEKKSLFGGTVPNLNGFEYYVGGIFVMPDYQPQQSPQPKSHIGLVSEWDWRNRHGKNWMTPVKDQGTCGSCWAFAVAGTIEAYINLYYNSLLNINLSEQQLISGVYPHDGCIGGNPEKTFQYIMKNGIVNETCFPYQEKEIDLSNMCTAPKERIWIDSIINIEYPDYDIDDVKRLLFHSPICFGLSSWNHIMILIGYKLIKQGDVLYYHQNENTYKIDIKKNHAYIGSTAWTFKNSWGKDFGDNGYIHVLININDMYCAHAIRGAIKSQGRTSNDIVVSNSDGDPYSFWGIGSLPGYDPNFADGNDASSQEGPLDSYGYTIPLTFIGSVINWNANNTVANTVFIQDGGVLNVSATITMSDARMIIVQKGGKLLINGGSLKNATIYVENGGQLQIVNNGAIELRNASALEVKKGGILDISSGLIN